METVTKKIMTLAFVRDGARVLLGMKKQGFGAGRWNGFGGKVEAGEEIRDAAARELREEAGIAADLEEAGVLDFSFTAKPGEVLEVHLFRADGFSGKPRESDEMRPQWFAADAIPFDDMWPDDRDWLPQCLAGKSVHGAYTFGPGDSIIKRELQIA